MDISCAVSFLMKNQYELIWLFFGLLSLQFYTNKHIDAKCEQDEYKQTCVNIIRKSNRMLEIEILHINAFSSNSHFSGVCFSHQKWTFKGLTKLNFIQIQIQCIITSFYAQLYLLWPTCTFNAIVSSFIHEFNNFNFLSYYKQPKNKNKISLNKK